MAKSNGLNQLVDTMEGWYSKLPSLPKQWVETLVMITPWVALIFGILGVLALLAALGVLTALSPFMLLGAGVGAATGSLIGTGLALVSSVLLLMAFPGTKAHKMSGWNLLFWSEAVSAVSAVVSMAFGGVVGAAIGFYILFQIKSHYK